MTHPFGDLLRQYRARKHGLSQTRLAELAGYDPSLVGKMAQGRKELTGPSGRERVVRLIVALREEHVLATLDEANALLRAAGMAPLFEGHPAEMMLMAGLARTASQPEPDGVTLAFQPPRARGSLPAPLNRFIGRKRQVADLVERVRTTRLLTLTGAGGSGKSRLALEVGGSGAVASAFPDGVWLIELAPLADSALVPQTVASTLGLPEKPSRTPLNTLTTNLSGKRLLLILDNCEHLIGACAELVEALLRGCPNLCVLATSREALNVPGEVVWQVPPLVPDEAAQLFVERAQVVQMNFALTNQNVVAVTEICLRLDGMPLAIELAAARLRMLSVEQIASRLDDRFALLTGGGRTALPRQQTLRAAIDWSYNLLSEGERALLQRLSVFVGGYPLEAAEVVCGDQALTIGDIVRDARPPIATASVLGLLAGLVDKSLVTVVTESHDGRVRDGRVRYRLLETIRQFAADRLREAGQTDTLRDRHLAYYLVFAEQADANRAADKSRPRNKHIEAERDNLLAALGWCETNATQPAYAEVGLRIAVALIWFWAGNNYDREALHWLSEITAWNHDLPHTVAHPTMALQAQALFYTWTFIVACGEWHRRSDMTALAEAHLARCRAAGDPVGTAYCLVLLANMARLGDDLPRAQALAMESLALFDDTRDVRGISDASYILAAILQARHAYAEQVTLMETYIRRLQELGDRSYFTEQMRALARGLVLQGWCEQASAVCEQLLAEAEGDDPFLAWYVFGTLRVADHARALALTERHVVRRRQAGDERSLAAALHQLGATLMDGGAYDQARAPLDESVALWRTLDISWGTNSIPSRALCDRGILARFQGDYCQAIAIFDESERLCTEREDVWFAAAVLLYRGYALLGSGDVGAAAADFKESLRQFHGRRQGLTPYHPQLLAAFSEVTRVRGQALQAMRLAGAAAAFEEETRLFPPNERFDFDLVMAAARARLDNPALAAAWAEGEGMTLDEAVAYALQGSRAEAEADGPSIR